jgi:hypothetical protein
MKWLEVIKLRSVGESSGVLEEFLRSLSQPGPRGLAKMKTFRHAGLETDLSVHLYWNSEKPESNGSALGLRLVQALKEFGLIDHSVWVEENPVRPAS